MRRWILLLGIMLTLFQTIAAESITFKLMQMDGELTLFVWEDGGWQKTDAPVLRMIDARNPNTPVPTLHKNFPQTGDF